MLLLAYFKKKKRKVFLLISLLTFFFFSNRFLSDEAIRILEYKPVHASELRPHYDAVIVLGGYMVEYDNHFKRYIFRKNTDRLLQAMLMYEEGRTDKIIISSGSGNIYRRDMRESVLLRDFLYRLNYTPGDIIIDSLSDNTYQNAKYTAEIIQNNKEQYQSLLLITSSYHMKRAQACFRKQGIACDIFPVDYITGKRKFEINHLIIPHPNAFRNWNIFIHETAGYVMYRLVGYI